jgi:hypothetical protein
MSMTEPATMITDYVLAAAGLVFCILLLRSRGPSKAALLWTIGLFTAAAAAAFGGTYHGFAHYTTESTQRMLWNTTAALIGATAGFMISAGVIGGVGINTKWLRAGLWISLSGLAIQQLRLSPHRHFNHNDLYHLVQMVGLYCFYRGASGRKRK